MISNQACLKQLFLYFRKIYVHPFAYKKPEQSLNTEKFLDNFFKDFECSKTDKVL